MLDREKELDDNRTTARERPVLQPTPLNTVAQKRAMNQVNESEQTGSEIGESRRVTTKTVKHKKVRERMRESEKENGRPERTKIRESSQEMSTTHRRIVVAPRRQRSLTSMEARPEGLLAK